MLLRPLCFYCSCVPSAWSTFPSWNADPSLKTLGVFPPESLTQPPQRGGRSSTSLYYLGVFLFSLTELFYSHRFVRVYYLCMLLLLSSCIVSWVHVCAPFLCVYHPITASSWVQCIFMLFVSCPFVPKTCHSAWRRIKVSWMNEWFSENLILSKFTW